MGPYALQGRGPTTKPHPISRALPSKRYLPTQKHLDGGPATADVDSISKTSDLKFFVVNVKKCLPTQ